jgi:hypothetical protein
MQSKNRTSAGGKNINQGASAVLHYVSKFELSSGLVVHTMVQLGNGRTKERRKRKKYPYLLSSKEFTASFCNATAAFYLSLCKKLFSLFSVCHCALVGPHRPAAAGNLQNSAAKTLPKAPPPFRSHE